MSGIQWVPAEATSVLPSGAQPANDDVVSSWTRTGRLNAEEERSVKEWCVQCDHLAVFVQLTDVGEGSATRTAAVVAKSARRRTA